MKNCLSILLVVQTVISLASSMEVTIVGSGAAALSAAVEAARTGANVLIIEKTKNGGGNSAKASSGINGAETMVQSNLNIVDSVDSFEFDTMKVGQQIGDKKLVEKVTAESQAAISFLVEEMELPLTDVIQLGGHSAPRTHRLSTHAPIGFSLVKALKSKLEKMENVMFEYSAEMTELIWHDEDDERVIDGVVYLNSEGEEISHMSNSVILASGGMAHSIDTDGIFAEFAPQLRGLATSSGPQADGRGMVIARQAGAELIDMEYIQLHPTGLVDPSSPSALSKILGPETLRGVGGILVLKSGERFVNELARRGHVTSEIRNKGDVLGTLESGREQHTACILMNAEAVEKFSPKMFGFYEGRGIFKKYDNSQAMCDGEGINCENLSRTFETYSAQEDGTEDYFGKTRFPVRFTSSEPIWIGRVTPVIHYTMGGLKIDTRAAVVRAQGGFLKNLYAAGECTGGVHGGDRLAGNSLLECVVMGRTAGSSATFTATLQPPHNDEL